MQPPAFCCRLLNSTHEPDKSQRSKTRYLNVLVILLLVGTVVAVVVVATRTTGSPGDQFGMAVFVLKSVFEKQDYVLFRQI